MSRTFRWYAGVMPLPTHPHTLFCLKRDAAHPDCVAEPFELVCGYGPTIEPLDEAAVRELGISTIVAAWVHDNVEFSEDGWLFRLKADR